MTAHLPDVRWPIHGRDEIAAAVSQAFGAFVKSVRDIGARRWRLSIGGKPAAAEIEDEWLVIEARVRRRTRDPIRLLEKNSALGGAKLVLRDDGSLRLRCELPIDAASLRDSTAFAHAVQVALAELAMALGAPVPASGRCQSDRLVSGRPEADHDSPGRDPAEREASSSECDLACLCSELGWEFSPRSSGISVDLEVGDRGFYQAAVESRNGHIGQSVNLLKGVDAPIDEISGLAIAALLLDISGSVRMATASAWGTDEGRAFGFWVRLLAPPSREAFVHGLSALSLACSLCSREVEVLAGDPGLAWDFLAMRHPHLLHRTRKRKAKAV